VRHGKPDEGMTGKGEVLKERKIFLIGLRATKVWFSLVLQPF